MDKKALAESVSAISQAIQQLASEHRAVMAVLAALIESHPDPQAFAQAFRSTWRRVGEPNSDVEQGEHSIRGADGVLTIVEEYSHIPLGLRPPRTSID